MAPIFALLRGLAAALSIFGTIVAAFRKLAFDGLDPEPVAAEIDRPLDEDARRLKSLPMRNSFAFRRRNFQSTGL
jgi:hypothetical protein